MGRRHATGALAAEADCPLRNADHAARLFEHMMEYFLQCWKMRMYGVQVYHGREENVCRPLLGQQSKNVILHSKVVATSAAMYYSSATGMSDQNSRLHINVRICQMRC
jgi:hypothetical protein